MVRLNTIVSSLDKNTHLQEPKVHGSMRKVGHVRSIWQAMPANYGAHWLG
eukprot:CAMPEP_0170445184 /NCGR_PEP_ID=MMETSP0117_2-20130122/48929_1 /TAXON_ID=400756 /ORGANISM="Durinskia baltica, Strain CSIRO CS-38" /LENGTH=49 /DNA_ID= /DNA_START= /DNA_END= /DNA_ORIENTATION=